MPATGTARSIEPLRQSETSAVAGMARSYGAVGCLVSRYGFRAR